MRVILKKVRRVSLFKVVLGLFTMVSISLGIGEEPKSPFERGVQPVAVNKPTKAVPSRLDKIEFTGLLGFGGEVTISLYNTQTKQSLWVPLDGAKDGYSVSGFDEENGTIFVTLQGATRKIAINENEIVALGRTEPIVSPNKSVPAPPKKPVRIKDDETLRKEEEARSFVSNLLANGMQQREEFRKAREVRANRSQN